MPASLGFLFTAGAVCASASTGNPSQEKLTGGRKAARAKRG